MLRPSGVLVVLLLRLLLLAAIPSVASAEPHAARVVRGVVYVDGQERWRGRAVTSSLAWSERHDALAFAARDQRGVARLVVLIVDDDLEPAAFSWVVPPKARPARAVIWLGEGRVGAGPSVLKPAMVAEYSLAK